jgi:hypothetical protein
MLKVGHIHDDDVFIVPSHITLIFNKKEYHIRTNFGLPNIYPSMLYLLNLESREQLDLEHQEV